MSFARDSPACAKVLAQIVENDARVNVLNRSREIKKGDGGEKQRNDDKSKHKICVFQHAAKCRLTCKLFAFIEYFANNVDIASRVSFE